MEPRLTGKALTKSWPAGSNSRSPFREPEQPRAPARAGKSWAQAAGGALLGALTGTIGRELVRGVFGMLGAKRPRRARW